MDSWLVNVGASVVGGLLVSLIEVAIRRWRSRSLDWRRSVGTGAIIGAAVLIILTYLPPATISWTEWCLTSQQTTRVTGEVFRSLLRTPAVGIAIQVKLFPAGSTQALQVEQFGFTDWNGRFAAEFPSPQPGRGMYLINTAYNYDSPLWSDRWYIKDFRKANPPACR